MLDQLIEYQDAGMALCRIPDGAKSPIEAYWQLNPAGVDEFKPKDNVGVILGPLSGGLVCVDLDFHGEDAIAWEEAARCLPDTDMADGRPGKPRSHLFYRITDTHWGPDHLPKPSSDTRQAMDCGALPYFAGIKHMSDAKGRGIDLIGAGGQVVIPPSKHHTGVCREWDEGERGEPTAIAYDDLLNAVHNVCLALSIPLPSEREEGLVELNFDKIDTLDEDKRKIRSNRLKSYLDAIPTRAHGRGENYHQQQWEVACRCCEIGAHPMDALPLYLDWQRRSDTPDDDEKMQATLSKAYKEAEFDKEGRELEGIDISAIIGLVEQTDAAVDHAGHEEERGIVCQSMAETPPEKPEWLWPGYLLRKGASLLAAKQGLGKGLLIADAIARLSRGEALQGQEEAPDRPLRTLIVTREDDPHMSLRPRLDAAGANPEHVLWTVGDYYWSSGQALPVAEMRSAARQIEITIREHQIDLVVIDPIGAWFTDDSASDNAVRAIIDPMNQVARRTGCAVLFVAHVRKGSDGDKVDKIAGSHQMSAAVRVAMIAEEVDDRRRTLEVVKSNFRKPSSQHVWQIVPPEGDDPDEAPSVTWQDMTMIELACAKGAAENADRAAEADEVLMVIYRNNGPMRARELQTALGWGAKKMQRLCNDLRDAGDMQPGCYDLTEQGRNRALMMG